MIEQSPGKTTLVTRSDNINDAAEMWIPDQQEFDGPLILAVGGRAAPQH